MLISLHKSYIEVKRTLLKNARHLPEESVRTIQENMWGIGTYIGYIQIRTQNA